MKKLRFNFLHIFSSSSGVSLAELMVAVGGAAILFLASAMLITNIFRSDKLSVKRSDEISITKHISQLLSDEKFCTETLKGKVVPTNAVTTLVLPDGITDSASAQYYLANGKKIGEGNISINDYSLDTTDPEVGINTASNSTVGMADFVIEFDRGQLADQNRIYQRKLRLFIELEDSVATPLVNRVIKKCKIGDGIDLGYWIRRPVTGDIYYDRNNSSGTKGKVLVGTAKEKNTPLAAANAVFLVDNSIHQRSLGLWINGRLNLKSATSPSNPAATINQTFRAIDTMKIPIRGDGCSGCPRGAVWIKP